MYLRGLGCEKLHWIEVAQNEFEWVSGLLKSQEFFDRTSNYRFLKAHPAPWYQLDDVYFNRCAIISVGFSEVSFVDVEFI